jgi:hypothetical protein
MSVQAAQTVAALKAPILGSLAKKASKHVDSVAWRKGHWNRGVVTAHSAVRVGRIIFSQPADRGNPHACRSADRRGAVKRRTERRPQCDAYQKPPSAQDTLLAGVAQMATVAPEAPRVRLWQLS